MKYDDLNEAIKKTLQAKTTAKPASKRPTKKQIEAMYEKGKQAVAIIEKYNKLLADYVKTLRQLGKIGDELRKLEVGFDYYDEAYKFFAHGDFKTSIKLERFYNPIDKAIKTSWHLKGVLKGIENFDKQVKEIKKHFK